MSNFTCSDTPPCQIFWQYCDCIQFLFVINITAFMHVTFYCIAEFLLPHIHYISGRMRPMKILCTTPTTSGSHYIWPSLLFSSTFQDTSGSRWREGSWSSLEKAQLQGTSFHIYETSIMLQGYKLGLSWAKLIKFSAHARGWDIWSPPWKWGNEWFLDPYCYL